MQQTQRTILWVIFVMSLVFLWDAWNRDHGGAGLFGAPPPAQQQAAADGTPGTTPGGSLPGAPAGQPADGSIPDAPQPSAAATGTTAPATVPAVQTAQTDRVVKLVNDVISLDVGLTGGTLTHAELLQHRNDENVANLTLLDSTPARFYQGQTGVVGVAGAPNHTTAWEVVSGPTGASATEPATLVLRAASGGVTVERTYSLAQGSYLLKLQDKVSNSGDQSISPTVYRQLSRTGNPPTGGSAMYSTYAGPVIFTDEGKFQKVPFGDIEKGKPNHVRQAGDGWFGIIQHYFVVAWVQPGNAMREYTTRRISDNLYAVGDLQQLGQIAPGQSVQSDSEIYIGPQNQKVLAQIAPGLDLVVDYGWLTAIAKPLFWLLDLLHSWVGNWGWAIVLLTIVVKLAFFPLQAASYRSMAKMRKVTPKMQAIRERHGDDRMKMNQAMMELYKTEKINPLGGCLPVVVQIPVFIALYWVLLASVEMRNAPWIGWIKDLSAPDTLFGTIPWLNMPLGLLPILMAATMIIQTRLNPTPPDPMQAKLMMWMPIIFSVMFFFFPSGLVLYWLVSNLFSIIQQWVITRKIEGKPVFGRAPSA